MPLLFYRCTLLYCCATNNVYSIRCGNSFLYWLLCPVLLYYCCSANCSSCVSGILYSSRSMVLKACTCCTNQIWTVILQCPWIGCTSVRAVQFIVPGAAVMREEGTTSDVDTLYWMREAELKHGRVAQLAGLWYIINASCDYQLSMKPLDEASDGIASLVPQFVQCGGVSPLRFFTRVAVHNYCTVWYHPMDRFCFFGLVCLGRVAVDLWVFVQLYCSTWYCGSRRTSISW